MTYEITLPNTRRVSEFVALANKYESQIRATSGTYTANAKSIMGIFSLDLSKPLILNADTDDEELIKETFADFIGEE